jgi:hypothetical protein
MFNRIVLMTRVFHVDHVLYECVQGFPETIHLMQLRLKTRPNRA